MNDKNRNPWDGRRPSLDRWWETPENENDEMPEKITSPPKAVENTKQWIDRSSQQPNENTGGKNRKVSIAKKLVNEQNNFIVYKILYNIIIILCTFYPSIQVFKHRYYIYYLYIIFIRDTSTGHTY